jgi:integrase-like protein
MGRPGSALDNAVIESWHSTLEFELRSLQHFATRAQARAAVAAWIEDYSTRRRHSACQKLPPAAYEQLLAERGKEVPNHDESASPSPSIGRSLPRSRSYVLALLRASPS